MNSDFYSLKNAEDFEKNTSVILAALKRIESDLTLKPSIAQLENLTGLHRNTLSKRVWPKERLDEIKKSRSLKNEVIEVSNKATVSTLEDMLDRTKNELVYWFNKVYDLEQKNRQLIIQIERMKESNEFYRKKSEGFELELKRLNDIIQNIT